jgi:hypothetical protein
MLDRLRFAPYRREVELEKRDAGDYQREPNPIVNVPPNASTRWGRRQVSRAVLGRPGGVRDAVHTHCCEPQAHHDAHDRHDAIVRAAASRLITYRRVDDIAAVDDLTDEFAAARRSDVS